MAVDRNQIETKLDNFQVIKNPYLRRVIYILPYIIFLFLLVDWLLASGRIGFAKDSIRLSLTIGYALGFLLANRLFAQLPVSLRIIWERGLLSSKSESLSTEKDFLDYLERLETVSNNKVGFLSGFVFILVALMTTFSFRFWLLQGQFIRPEAFIVFQLTFASLFGLIAWRIFVIAFFIDKLGRQFKIGIIPNHHDRSGGLKPLGNLCLSIAYVILVPIIIMSIWLTVGDFYEIVWGGVFRQWLLVLIIISVFAFFLPLYGIHKQMEKESLKIERELDELSSESEKISHTLRMSGDTIELNDGEELLKRLDFLGKIQDSNRKIPKWPFDTNIILKFSTAQIVPVLSLLGLSEPIIKLVQGFTQVMQNL